MGEAAASGGGANALANVTVAGLSKQDDAILVCAHKGGEEAASGEDDTSESEGSDDDDGEQEDEKDDKDPTEDNGFEGLVPAEGAEALRGDDNDVQEQALVDANGKSIGKGGSATAEAPIAAAPSDVSERPEASGEENEEGDNDEEDSEEEEEEVGQVVVSTGGRKVRRRQTAKEARKNLQKQQKQKPARANNQKVTQARQARHQIKEYLS